MVSDLGRFMAGYYISLSVHKILSQTLNFTGGTHWLKSTVSAVSVDCGF